MKTRWMIAAGLAALCGVAQAEMVTFEQGNQGVAVTDNMAVQDQYQAQAGVRFRTGTGTVYGAFAGSAYIEEVGQQAGPGEHLADGDGSNSGFTFILDGLGSQFTDTVCPGLGLDGLTEAARQEFLGEYFLRTPGYSQDSLAVTYDAPVSAASFEIWDIDGNASGGEGWTIKAFDAGWDAGSQKFVLTTPFCGNSVDTNSYDGQRYVVRLAQGGMQFDRFVIEFGVAGETNKPSGNPVGLAFNNFDTTQIPEPASIGLVGMVVCGLLFARRRIVKA